MTLVDVGCRSNSCNTLRKGLCALAPANNPRTPLPQGGSCQPVDTGAPGWIYPDYPWTEEGTLGEVSGSYFEVAKGYNKWLFGGVGIMFMSSSYIYYFSALERAMITKIIMRVVESGKLSNI